MTEMDTFSWKARAKREQGLHAWLGKKIKTRNTLLTLGLLVMKRGSRHFGKIEFPSVIRGWLKYNIYSMSYAQLAHSILPTSYFILTCYCHIVAYLWGTFTYKNQKQHHKLGVVSYLRCIPYSIGQHMIMYEHHTPMWTIFSLMISAYFGWHIAPPEHISKCMPKNTAQPQLICLIAKTIVLDATWS